MRGIWFSQKIDPADDLLGFVCDWVSALAARLDGLDVIALEAHPADLGENVRVFSLGKEQGAGRAGYLLQSQRALLSRLGRADFVLCHMIPLYALISAPLAKLTRTPLTMWYAHNHVDLKLKAAIAASRLVFTSVPQSMPIQTPKRRVVGQGINAERFKPAPVEPDRGPFTAVTVGRISPRKRLEVLVEAAEILKSRGRLDDFRLLIIGREGLDEQAAYAAELKQRVADSGLGGAVEFRGHLPHAQVPDLLRTCRAFVSMQDRTGFDKAVLEAMACGLPTVVSHDCYLPLLGEAAPRLHYRAGDATALADRLIALADTDPAARRELAEGPRSRVLAEHELGRLMDRILDEIRPLTGRRDRG